MQKTRLWENIRTLEEQSLRAIHQDREDLAKLALERKNANMLRLQELDKQITDMQTQQDRLEQTEKRLATKVEEFRSRKEVIKAQYYTKNLCLFSYLIHFQKEWKLKPGEKLEWNWIEVNNKMVMTIKKANN
jgi:hypothetical protein